MSLASNHLRQLNVIEKLKGLNNLHLMLYCMKEINIKASIILQESILLQIVQVKKTNVILKKLLVVNRI